MVKEMLRLLKNTDEQDYRIKDKKLVNLANPPSEHQLELGNIFLISTV